jgi:hypothetical protein
MVRLVIYMLAIITARVIMIQQQVVQTDKGSAGRQGQNR